MANKNVLNRLLLEDRVIYMERGAARISEDVVNALILKRANDHLATGKHFRFRIGDFSGRFWAHR